MIKKPVIGKTSKVVGLVLLGLVIFFILFSGCTEAAIKSSEKGAGVAVAAHAGAKVVNQMSQESARKSGTAITIVDETKTLPEKTFFYYLLSGDEGYQFDIDVTTDGAPVDILIMDEQTYQEYSSAFKQGKALSFNAVTFKNTAAKTLEYSLPSRGDYYLVIENSPLLEGGADANRALNVRVLVTLTQ
ncbi:MAG: hypothetical protein LUQ31_01240 [Methanoregula sp.]|nr:hypothetical protein [Methanoregula sp.]